MRINVAAAMQDRYAGDVGDFMKFGLLRAVSGGVLPLRLGVNWYLTGDESNARRAVQSSNP